ncbi:hypothetical protein PVAG01_08826 [Phlyctema vagabunda]|uniref:Uncharacterized protein n=1 Tax=Phlyctema vagabunda TaxID=108571 RepID=A0ABR4PAM2_9HELO
MKPEEPTARELIRRALEAEAELEPPTTPKEWGFVIYRCTYQSQEKWEKFISTIQELAKEHLEQDCDQDLWETLQWTIIEDPELDGASYAEASRWHDKWVQCELGRDKYRLHARIVGRTLDEYFERGAIIRHGYFIHVDEDVLESFKAYYKTLTGSFFTLVSHDRTRIQRAVREMHARKSAGELLPEDEILEYRYGDVSVEDMSVDVDFDERRMYWQRFKAWDLVVAYAALLEIQWDEFYVDDEEICQIFHVS